MQCRDDHSRYESCVHHHTRESGLRRPRRMRPTHLGADGAVVPRQPSIRLAILQLPIHDPTSGPPSNVQSSRCPADDRWRASDPVRSGRSAEAGGLAERCQPSTGLGAVRSFVRPRAAHLVLRAPHHRCRVPVRRIPTGGGSRTGGQPDERAWSWIKHRARVRRCCGGAVRRCPISVATMRRIPVTVSQNRVG